MTTLDEIKTLVARGAQTGALHACKGITPDEAAAELAEARGYGDLKGAAAMSDIRLAFSLRGSVTAH